MTGIDDLLAASAPRPLSDDPAVRSHVTAMVTESRAPRRRHSKLVLVIPAVGLGALALTGGALVVNTIDTDVTVPLTITTVTGETVTCSAELGAGAENFIDDFALSAFVRDHDWSNLGQRAYARATAAADPGTPEFSWIEGLSQEVNEAIPTSLLGMGSAWTTVGENCELR
jgi:hypothetical protein